MGVNYYVDASVGASGDGTSWAQAKKTIAEGIAAATATGAADDEIRVMTGTYAETITLTTATHGDLHFNIVPYDDESTPSTSESITLNGATRSIYSSGNFDKTGGSLTISYCNLDPVSLESARWQIDMSLTLNHCTLTPADADKGVYVLNTDYDHDYVRDITITNCTLTVTGDKPFYVLNARDVTVTDCTFNVTGNFHVIDLTGKQRRVKIRDNIITSTDGTNDRGVIVTSYARKGLQLCDISGNTMTGVNQGMSVPVSDGAAIVIDNNDITLRVSGAQKGISVGSYNDNWSHANTASGGGAGYILLSGCTKPDDYWNGGTINIVDGTGAGQTRAVLEWDLTGNPVGEKFLMVTDNWDVAPDNTSKYEVRLSISSKSMQVTRNTIRYLGTGTHGIFIGQEIMGGEVAYNDLYQAGVGDFRLVVKGRNVSIHHNVICGIEPILLSGAQGCTITNNTIIATSGNCVGWQQNDISSDGTEPLVNIVKNNILDCSGTGSYCLRDADGDHYNLICDYNVYNYGANNIAYLNGTPINGLAGLQAAWADTAWGDYENMYTVNDANSVVGDPLLIQ